MGQAAKDNIIYRIRFDESEYVTTQVSPKGLYWTEAACKSVITRELKDSYGRYAKANRDQFRIEKWMLVPYED